jgi:hypothetical protein
MNVCRSSADIIMCACVYCFTFKVFPLILPGKTFIVGDVVQYMW